MSSLRRILVAGLPAAGLTVAASLALAGSPATAVADHGARPVVTATPCAASDRDKCDYGNAGNGTSAGGAGTPATGGAGTPATGGHTRGHGGYGTVTTTPPATTPATTKPTPTPSTTTPTGNVDTVPPTGVSPSVTIQGGVTPTPSGGVSAGHALPVTGAPMSAIISLGTLMIAGGAASVWYTRRRRSA
jgi:LPXTG-motif cell wall-anchored protein